METALIKKDSGQMNIEEEFHVMSKEVVDLKVANAALSTSVEHLASSVQALTLTVQTMRDTINQGRGVLWVMMGVAGTIGATVATVVQTALGLK